MDSNPLTGFGIKTRFRRDYATKNKDCRRGITLNKMAAAVTALQKCWLGRMDSNPLTGFGIKTRFRRDDASKMLAGADGFEPIERIRDQNPISP